MKSLLLLLLLTILSCSIKSQTCDELMEYVKKEGGFGTTYSSYSSDAISRVTFYQLSIDFQTYYFAIVCFKSKYSFQCSEYIYQVSSNTKSNYMREYHQSAGKAFWNYIQPHNKNLGCAPDFD
jgi:hypothetical protein